jgi:hypothetical protein
MLSSVSVSVGVIALERFRGLSLVAASISGTGSAFVLEANSETGTFFKIVFVRDLGSDVSVSW